MLIGRTLAPPRISCASNGVGTTPSPTISAAGGVTAGASDLCSCDAPSTAAVAASTAVASLTAVAALTADWSARTRITTLEELGAPAAGQVLEPHRQARRKLPATMAPTASER